MARNKTKLLTYCLVIVGTFFLLFTRPGAFSPLKSTVIDAASWPLRIISFPFVELKKILFYHRTFNEYVKLRQETHSLRSRLLGISEVWQENNRLRQLLELKKKIVYPSAAAHVIGRDPSSWNAALLIDRGTRDGLSIDMPVVESLGVVGKLAEVTDDKSKVILLNDPAFSVAAVVRRSRETGLVVGTLQGLCRMRYLSAEADVRVGDEVVTAKVSSSFPEGLLVGTVVAVESNENSQTLECLVKPAVPLTQVEEVLIIKK